MVLNIVPQSAEMEVKRGHGGLKPDENGLSHVLFMRIVQVAF